MENINDNDTVKINKESKIEKKLVKSYNDCECEDDNNNNKVSCELYENELLLGGIKNLLSTLNDENNCISDEILDKTPQRFLKAFSEFTSGYKVNLKDLIEGALFDSEDYDDIIIIDDIIFTSLCEHHLLPFSGKVTIAYIPAEKILGLSKFARVVQAFSNRLNLQERLTKQILDCLNQYLKPKGCIVEITSKHACMCLRGIKSIESNTRTLKSSGLFNDDEKLMRKFFSLRK